MFYLVVVFVLVVIALGAWAYWMVIRNHMAVVATAVDKPAMVAAANSGLDRFFIRLQGWKTHIAAWLAALFGVFAAIPADVINSWTSLPWATFVDQKVAAGIAIFLTMVVPILHAQGLVKTATTIPSGDSATSS